MNKEEKLWRQEKELWRQIDNNLDYVSRLVGKRSR